MSMKTVITGTLFTLSLALAETIQAGTIWQANGSGRNLQAQFSDDRGGGTLIIQQNGDSTFLFYERLANDPGSESCQVIFDEFGNPVEVCTFTSIIYDWGYGAIPNTALQFSLTGATLELNTGVGFINNRCTINVAGSTPITTCGPSQPQSFELIWTANGLSTTSNVGASQRTLGDFKFTSVSTLQAGSAHVNGVALGGVQLTLAPGTIGTTKGKHVATD